MCLHTKSWADSWQNFPPALLFSILSKCFSLCVVLGYNKPASLISHLPPPPHLQKTMPFLFIKAHSLGLGWMSVVKYRLWSCVILESLVCVLGPEWPWCYYCCCCVLLVLWRPSQTSICCSHCWKYGFLVWVVGPGGSFLTAPPPSFDKLHCVWVVERVLESCQWGVGFWFHSGTIVPLYRAGYLAALIL